ncbi:Cleavage and polyadenylation specificity factor subunit [Arachis hypogaea]|nr:Cleavage and polyadenylation specificity factor subunit [Arachis hypogaea]
MYSDGRLRIEVSSLVMMRVWEKWKGTLLRIVSLHSSLVARWKSTLLRCGKALSFVSPPGEGGKAHFFDVERHSPSFMILLEIRNLEINVWMQVERHLARRLELLQRSVIALSKHGEAAKVILEEQLCAVLLKLDKELSYYKKIADVSVKESASENEELKSQIEAACTLVEKLVLENAELVEKINMLYVELDRHNVEVGLSGGVGPDSINVFPHFDGVASDITKSAEVKSVLAQESGSLQEASVRNDRDYQRRASSIRTYAQGGRKGYDIFSSKKQGSADFRKAWAKEMDEDNTHFPWLLYSNLSASCALALNSYAISLDNSQEMSISTFNVELDAANAT